MIGARLGVAAAMVAVTSSAFAQTTLVASPTVVTPGTAVSLTVSGTPGGHFAIVGSTVGSGLSFGGAGFAVGPDVQVITIGLLDGEGRAAIQFMPPFAGSTLDRFYLQAVTSASPSFVPPTLSNGVILRNADALAAPAGGDLSGTYPNPTIAPSSGGRIVDAINASSSTINDARLSSAIATKAYVDTAVGGSIGVGATAGGDLAGSYPNPTIAASAGGRIVDAINASSSVISDARVATTLARTAYVDSGDATRVALGPSADQDLSTTNPLVRVRQRGSGDLMSLRTNSTAVIGAAGLLVDQEMFRVLADGGFVARGSLSIGASPSTGAGVRMHWYPARGALRAGRADTDEWDDSNQGTYSMAGGRNNTAMGLATFATGESNKAMGPWSTTLGHSNTTTLLGHYGFAVGLQSMSDALMAIAIGLTTAACGNYSMALGYRAVTSSQDPTVQTTCNGTRHEGAFVWSDHSSTSFFKSSANNQFSARAAGGVRFYTNSGLTAGVTLTAGDSTWNSVSDVNAKTAFRELDGEEVLRKLSAMPIQEWSYKTNEGVRHVGPTAQDFYGAFGLGSDPLKISTIDPGGIALRAVQALEERTRALATENAQLRALLEEALALLRER